jgi:A/G-specific adenine glycosylase
MNLASYLLAWYDANKRDLPWRCDKDPYKIWVSEVMLQQTRVEAVKPYFARWMERFPTIQALAASTEEEVVRVWQGLGYYSRARNLLSGVREVAENYGAQIPDSRDEIEKLTGIGEYTAGAILSIAYNKPEPAVDGNVLRVFSRLFAIADDIMRSGTRRKITQLVREELPHERPGDFNQALMDLGSAVCIPKEPRCAECPVVPCCAAYREGRQRALPVRTKGKPPTAVEVAAGIICHEGSYLLRRRHSRGVLAGLWEFPAVEIAPGEKPEAKLAAAFRMELDQDIRVEALCFRTTHTFSHRVWKITFYHCALESFRPLAVEARAVWRKPADWEDIPFAGPHRKVAEQILNKRIP